MLVCLWASTDDLSLRQDEDGNWSIHQGDPIENEFFAPLKGDTPNAAIDAAIAAGKGEK